LRGPLRALVLPNLAVPDSLSEIPAMSLKNQAIYLYLLSWMEVDDLYFVTDYYELISIPELRITCVSALGYHIRRCFD
jgi:hypothetical protein